MNKAIDVASSGNDPSEFIEATIAAELEADIIKSDIQDHIGTGVRFAIGRDTFLHMLSRQDRIADYAQNVAEQLSFRKLYEDKKARNNLKKMASAVFDTVVCYEKAVDSLKELLQSGFSSKEKSVLLEWIREVNIKEHLADEIEAESAGHVFSTGDDDALAAMHMYRVLQRLDDVANACEKAANAFLPSISR